MAKSAFENLYAELIGAVQWRRGLEKPRADLRRQAATGVSAVSFYSVEVGSSFNLFVRMDRLCDDATMDAVRVF